MNGVRASKTRFEEQLIEHVKTKPAIWKKSDSNHGNAIFVSNNWNSVYDLIEPTPFVSDGAGCAKMWKALWGQWLAFKRKTKGKTGQSGGRVANFRHEMSMRFFDDPVEIEVMSSTFSNVADVTVNEDSEDQDGDPITNYEGQLENENSRSSGATTTEAFISQRETHTPKIKKPKLDAFGEQLLEVVKGKEMSEFEHFGSTIAIKLEKIAKKDPRAAVRLQSEIHTLVAEAEITTLYN